MDISIIHTSKVGGTVLLSLDKVTGEAVGVASLVHMPLPLWFELFFWSNKEKHFVSDLNIHKHKEKNFSQDIGLTYTVSALCVSEYLKNCCIIFKGQEQDRHVFSFV